MPDRAVAIKMQNTIKVPCAPNVHKLRTSRRMKRGRGSRSWEGSECQKCMKNRRVCCHTGESKVRIEVDNETRVDTTLTTALIYSAAQCESYPLYNELWFTSASPAERVILFIAGQRSSFSCRIYGNHIVNTLTYHRTSVAACRIVSRRQLVNLQRRFATHTSRTNLQTCYTFESLSKTCNTLQHCKYREKSFAMQPAVTLKWFFAQHRIIASWRCKLPSVTPP